MTLLAVPLDPTGLNDRTAQALLDGMLSVPAIFPVPGTMDERRILIASVLADPLNRVWLVWNGGQLTGCLLLTHIVLHIDAQCHLVFFDRTLFGRKTIIWNLMGRAFQELDLQRLTVEVPEYLTPLYKFVRKKLMFRLEGEAVAAKHPLVEKVQAAIKPYLKDGTDWIARLGSRRERACLNPETNTWTDMLRLRLLRSEYEQFAGGANGSRPTESLSPGGYPGSPSTADRVSPRSPVLSETTGGTR